MSDVAGIQDHLVRLQTQGVQVAPRRYLIAKRIMDVVLCVMALPLALPIMLVCAVCVWIEDPGPIMFCQSRTGKSGRRFKMYKFRTMVKNADELKVKYAHLNQLQWPDFKVADDPRVTRIGKFLRKTSLDEIPQLLNVIRGDMSLVGPRPTSFDVTTYDLWHTERLEVTPGITGLWQISGRSDLEFNERLRLDIEYIETRGIWLDIKILLKTVGAVIKPRGAY